MSSASAIPDSMIKVDPSFIVEGSVTDLRPGGKKLKLKVANATQPKPYIDIGLVPLPSK